MGVVLAIGAVATALLALGALAVKVGRPVVHTACQLREFLDDWRGEGARPGVPAKPGVMERLAVLEARTAELKPNGGTSIADAVRRIDARAERIEQQTGGDS